MNRTLTLALCGVLAGSAAAAQTTPTTQVEVGQRPQASPESYVALGNLYFDKGQYDSAYVAYRAASESAPNNRQALLGLGRAQTKLRLYTAAIETLRKLLSMDARNLPGHVALAQAYVAQYVGTGDRSSVQGNLDEALKVLADAEIIQPDSAIVWNERSLIHKLRGDYARAIEMSKRASAIDPNDSVILYNLGDLYQATGNLALAVDALQRAVIANPTDALARAYYGRLLLQSGKPEQARLELAQAERLAPNSAFAVGQYGVYGYHVNDRALARMKLSQALKLDPLRYPEFYYYLGRLQLDANQVREARSDFTKAAALASTNPEYYYWLGRTNELGGDKAAARAAYTQALLFDPNLQVAREGLARVK